MCCKAWLESLRYLCVCLFIRELLWNPALELEETFSECPDSAKWPRYCNTVCTALPSLSPLLPFGAFLTFTQFLQKTSLLAVRVRVGCSMMVSLRLAPALTSIFIRLYQRGAASLRSCELRHTYSPQPTNLVHAHTNTHAWSLPVCSAARLTFFSLVLLHSHGSTVVIREHRVSPHAGTQLRAAICVGETPVILTDD